MVSKYITGRAENDDTRNGAKVAIRAWFTFFAFMIPTLITLVMYYNLGFSIENSVVFILGIANPLHFLYNITDPLHSLHLLWVFYFHFKIYFLSCLFVPFLFFIVPQFISRLISSWVFWRFPEYVKTLWKQDPEAYSCFTHGWLEAYGISVMDKDSTRSKGWVIRFDEIGYTEITIDKDKMMKETKSRTISSLGYLALIYVLIVFLIVI